METSPRVPISSRSRQAVMERRAARAATPPRASRPNNRPAAGETPQAAGGGEAPPQLPPGLSANAKVKKPPALPPVSPITRSAVPNGTAKGAADDAKPAKRAANPASAPLPDFFLAPPPPAVNGADSTEVDVEAAAAVEAESERRESFRVRTPTMYQDDHDDDADENTGLLSNDAHSDMRHNAQLMSKLIDDVKLLKIKDAEIERVQEELAQIDDEVDDSCETLATFISLTFLAPTFTWTHTIVSLLLTMIVWGMQAVLTWKLYSNAKINDGGQVMLDLGSGYMEMNHTMASAECDGCCDDSVHSTCSVRNSRPCPCPCLRVSAVQQSSARSLTGPACANPRCRC
jgi:hypothetical protein